MKDRLERIKENIRERVGASSMLEVYGRREMLVCGCVALCDFDSEKVFIQTVDGLLSVFGECLEICAFRADIVSVKGKIEKIEFGGCICL